MWSPERVLALEGIQAKQVRLVYLQPTPISPQRMFPACWIKNASGGTRNRASSQIRLQHCRCCMVTMYHACYIPVLTVQRSRDIEVFIYQECDQPCLLQVCCSLDSSLVLAKDGTLYTFGDNSLGQLGRPSYPEHAPEDWVVRDKAGAPLRFERVAAGLGHCLAVTLDGKVCIKSSPRWRPLKHATTALNATRHPTFSPRWRPLEHAMVVQFLAGQVSADLYTGFFAQCLC